MTYYNWTYRGDHFEMCGSTKSLCFVPGTNNVLGLLYSKIKLIEKEIKFLVTRGWGAGCGRGGEGQSNGTNFQL